MKRLVIISFILILAITIGFASAKPILSIPDNLQPGETLLGQISLEGNSTFEKKLTTDDLQLFQGNKQINFQSDITLYNNIFYFYIMPTYEGNFTLKIPNILYKEGVLKSESFEKQITVKTNAIFDNSTNKTSFSILSIKPGFVISSAKAQITLENKGTENLSISYDNNNLLLASGATKIVYLEPIKQNKDFFWISFNTYKPFNIPFIFISLTEQQIINFLKPTEKNVSINIAAIEINQTCKDLQGQVCSTSQNCTGTPQYTGELCCLRGKCISATTVSYDYLFGVFAIIILAAIIYFIFYLVKHAKPKTSQEVLKESSLRYEKKQKLR